MKFTATFSDKLGSNIICKKLTNNCNFNIIFSLLFNVYYKHGYNDAIFSRN